MYNFCSFLYLLCFPTLYEHVLEWRPGIRHVPLLATLTQRGGNTIGEIQTTTPLEGKRYTQLLRIYSRITDRVSDTTDVAILEVRTIEMTTQPLHIVASRCRLTACRVLCNRSELRLLSVFLQLLRSNKIKQAGVWLGYIRLALGAKECVNVSEYPAQDKAVTEDE